MTEKVKKLFSSSEVFPSLTWIIEVVNPIVNKELETCRSAGLFGKSELASIEIFGSITELAKLLEYYTSLPEMFKVAKVDLIEGPELCCKVSLATGGQCNRCKRITDDIAIHPYWPGEKYNLCSRCVDVLLNINWPPFIYRNETDVYICTDEREWHEIKSGRKELPAYDNLSSEK
jgi:hypothetical protein